jgi:hypothetical protein
MGTPYTQDFNSLPNVTDGSDLATWVDNSTLPGWYIDENATGGASCNATSCNDRPTIEASYTSINNGGNAYIYASGTDRSLGSRAAGSTATIYYGVRIANSTGLTITSIYVDYYGEQWSIAENGANVNTNAFAYQVGATVTSLTAGSWTNVPALDFTQIWTSSQSAGLGGTACGGTSNQCLALDGNAAANRVRISGCISVSIPPGQEIMLRWADIDNPQNDHHLQIDDVSIYPFDVSCAIVLPVTWLSFTAERAGQTSFLQWETGSEENNNYFSIEKMNEDGYFYQIGTVDGHGTTSQHNSYSFTDEFPDNGYNYYRIRQVDYNGQSSVSAICAVYFGDDELFTAGVHYDGVLHFHQSGNHGATTISVFSEDGRVISSVQSSEWNGILETPATSGIYFIRFENEAGCIVNKQLIIL